MSDDFEVVGDPKEEELKEWRSVVAGKDGRTYVTVTLVRGKLSAKATARTSVDLPTHKRQHTIRKAAIACREKALTMLEEVETLDLPTDVQSDLEPPASQDERRRQQFDSWSIAEMRAFAERWRINIHGLKRKPEIVGALVRSGAFPQKVQAMTG